MKNSIKVLGAYGTKAKGFGTSAFSLDKRNVIDAGNLLRPLEEKSVDIENIWLTHSHLDHISDIAYILDNYYSLRKKTLNIIGLPQTIKAIKENFLNNHIWPDFSSIKMLNSDDMCVSYKELNLGEKYALDKNSSIEAFKTDHTVESCGYIYTKNNNSILITADTYSLDNVIEILDKRKDIKSMVIECSFPSNLEKLAKDSKHLTPKILFESLKKLKREDTKLYINHIKPFYLKTIISEIAYFRGSWEVEILKDEKNAYF